jgi:probable F420-dependent oxidoreductase
MTATAMRGMTVHKSKRLNARIGVIPMKSGPHPFIDYPRGDAPRLGVIFPQKNFFGTVRDLAGFARGVEDAGFDHIVAYDHVLGASTATRPGWTGAYNAEDPFIEPFVLFAYMAAIAPGLEYATGVLILPQRQTALVAKQAATLDFVTGGKFRLGVGIGWNRVEYDALNEDFQTRGRRLPEQIDLLRALTTHEVIDYSGTWHRVDHAGICPLGPQRPIPIWIGASADVAVRRAARIADGFFVSGTRIDGIEAVLAPLRDELARTGRDERAFGIEVRIAISGNDQDAWKQDMTYWREVGVSHVSLVTMDGPFDDLEGHLDRLVEAKRVWDAL